MNVGERIREFRESRSWTLADMANHLDVDITAQSLGRYELGKRSPDAELLEAIVRLGCDPAWLLGASAAPAVDARPTGASDAVPVERLAFRASAGSGALVIEPTGGTGSVRSELLRRLSLRAEYARLIEADGDSMLPTIHHGDPLVIDVSPEARARVVDNKIYAFTIGDEAYVKRLRREPGRIVMVSDNRDYPERAIPEGESIRIIGRVKWVEREL